MGIRELAAIARKFWRVLSIMYHCAAREIGRGGVKRRRTWGGYYFVSFLIVLLHI